MIIYRPHRGGLAEAMAEAKEFETEEEMKRHIYECHKAYFLDLGYPNAPFEVGDIVIDKWNDYKQDKNHNGRHGTDNV